MLVYGLPSFTADFLCNGQTPIILNISYYNLRAFSSEQQRTGSADTLRCASHYSNFAIYPFSHPVPIPIK